MVELIVQEWKQYITSIKRFNDRSSDDFYEEDRIPSLYLQLADFLRCQEPVLRKWMMDYLQLHRKDILIRWWVTHITEWAMDQIERFPKKKLHPRVNEDWDRFVGLIPFSTIYQIVMAHYAIRDISHCDIPDIINIHKGKRCDDCMYCFLCEDSENAWSNEINRRLKESLSSLLCIRETPYIDVWTPPYSYRNESGEYVDRNEYKFYLCERRIKKYNSNQSSREMIQELINETMYHSSWTLSNWKIKDDYELFLLLWNTLDIIPFSIRIDMCQIKHIEQLRKQIRNYN